MCSLVLVTDVLKRKQSRETMQNMASWILSSPFASNGRRKHFFSSFIFLYFLLLYCVISISVSAFLLGCVCCVFAYVCIENRRTVERMLVSQAARREGGELRMGQSLHFELLLSCPTQRIVLLTFSFFFAAPN